MDFVDLDKVLDEFEEEEKQALSIIPGQELKPSGYSEFLEKHQEQDWAALNENKFSSSSGYTLERRSAREPSNVSYDDPYDSFANSKLGFITDHQTDSFSHNGYEGVKRKPQSEIVTSLSRVSKNGENVNSVYTSTSTNTERKGIANSSERKGTIAYVPTEVQTDALTPNSERELMSSPFPKTDILVDGHGDTTVNNDSPKYDETDQNHSPIYASMDTVGIVTNSGTDAGHTHSSQTISSNQNQTSPGEQNPPESLTGSTSVSTNLQHATTLNGMSTGFSNEEETVGFHDSGDKDLDDSEVNMYLNDLDEGVMSDFNSSKSNVDYSPSHVPDNSPFADKHVPDIQSDLHSHAPVIDGKPRSLADELNEVEPEKDHYSMSHSESLPKKFRSDNPSAHDPDLVADLGLHSQQENVLQNSDENVNLRSVSDSVDPNRESVYNSIVNGKMEIENILDEKERTASVSSSVGENLLRGKMEIEGILDEVIQNQQNMVNHDLHSGQVPDKTNQYHSSQNQPDITQDTTRNQIPADEKMGDISQSLRDPNSLSPVHSLSSTNSESGSPVLSMGVGARPKDPSAIKKNRPNSLLGLSKVNLDLPTVVKMDNTETRQGEIPEPQQTLNSNFQSPTRFPDVTFQSQFVEPQTENDARQRMDGKHSTFTEESNVNPVIHDFSQSVGQEQLPPDDDQDHQAGDGHEDNSSFSHPSVRRPTSLNLPIRPDYSVDHMDDEDMEQGDVPVPPTTEQPEVTPDEQATGVTGESEGFDPSTMSESQPPNVQNRLGYEAPFWIPDVDAPMCMKCETKFTMWKRRHHCRACGKVLCSTCCNQKALLPYMYNKEARVCSDCHAVLSGAPGSTGPSPRCPNPNNPNEYCSKVPPNQQASNHANPPVVMVPTGVLKTSGSQRRSGEPKQVIFSDGIRPGGDLTELDGPDQTRPRRPGRQSRKAAQQINGPPARKTKDASLARSPCLVPEDGLPPLYHIQGDTGYIETDETVNQIDYTADYKAEGGPLIYYAVNKNLAVGIKIINLECCVNRVCWCFTTRGMDTAGQREIAILLELLEEEMTSTAIKPPTDVFLHLHSLYEEALKGNPVQDMGHSILHQNFLGNRDHGGFLYLRPTFQCLNKIPLPEPPYLFGVLLQKWEVPWAKVFPIRLLLRLGAEYRYYPCPLVSVRNRKPVFYEIGHTIINLLADFRNYQYMLTQIQGVAIHMENKKTIISFPRNRYNDVMKVVRNSNEHVMALGSSFSSEADSHLVCIQNEDGNYQTQAINIQNKPRLVTGASFVVFNGALKTSSGLRAKSSIVEDGLMIQVLPEAMVSIKEALKDMTDHTIQCGPADVSQPEEMVELKWVDNDKNFNIGVKSYIDGTSLEGVESVSVRSPSDFFGENLAIRWTCVYFLQHEDSGTSHFDPLDLSRLTEDIAQAACMALVKHLDELKKDGLVKLGLRVNLTRDAIGYEIGSKGQSLPATMINNLDTYLVPIVHQASEEGIIMELVFNIVD